MENDNRVFAQIIQEKIARINEQLEKNKDNPELRERLESDKHKLLVLQNKQSELSLQRAKLVPVKEEYLFNLYQEASRLEEYLKRLVEEGDSVNFIIIYLFPPQQDIYLQCLTNKGASGIHCEAAGNNTLSAKHQLSDSQIALLNKQGWLPPNNITPNFFQEFYFSPNQSYKQLTELILWTAEHVYGYVGEKEARILLNLE